jgi:hypothetical protein
MGFRASTADGGDTQSISNEPTPLPIQRQRCCLTASGGSRLSDPCTVGCQARSLLMIQGFSVPFRGGALPRRWRGDGAPSFICCPPPWLWWKLSLCCTLCRCLLCSLTFSSVVRLLSGRECFSNPYFWFSLQGIPALSSGVPKRLLPHVPMPCAEL